MRPNLNRIGRRLVLKVLAVASVGEKSGLRARTPVAGPKLILRRHAMMSALLLASFAMSGRAQADCTPASPVSNATVDCTGATLNANGTNGYGTATDSGNTITVESGATVTGSANGVRGGLQATVINLGTITGTTFDGIRGEGGSLLTVDNSGAVSGGSSGIDATSLSLTNRSSGTISSTSGAAASSARSASRG